jgi:hypothetical protein
MAHATAWLDFRNDYEVRTLKLNYFEMKQGK